MPENQIDFSVDKNNLYKEESITDLKTASIRCLVPINLDGTPDDKREKIYVGHTQLMSPQGPVPLQARLNAKTMEEAMDRFPAAMQQAMNDMIENVKKMAEEQEKAAREKDSGLILPR